MEVSVIIPTYKPGLYLFECLDSVVNQDFSKDKFEAVIVLNGEKNPYFENIESYFESRNINFKLLYTPVKGVSNARNIGLENIISKNVVFLDDDDILSTNFISNLYSSIYLNTIVVSNVKTFRADLNSLGDDYITRSYNKCYKKPEYSLFNYRGFMSSVCAKMIPIGIINGIRFDKYLSSSEDAAFMFTISCNVRNIKLADNDTIYFRRLRAGSTSRSNISFSGHFRNFLQIILKYSKVYFPMIYKYNILFYISRIVAASKCFLSSISYPNSKN
jgi:glycosyltransferase involved in cell wall biosynthesis